MSSPAVHGTQITARSVCRKSINRETIQIELACELPFFEIEIEKIARSYLTSKHKPSEQ
jgi:hypothetical protein